MNDLIRCALEEVPTGIVVFSQTMETVVINKKAERFYSRFVPPDEIEILCRRIFDAIRNSRFEALFPGEIYLYKKLEGSPSNWIFKFQVCRATADPRVCMFIVEESVANKLNVNAIRNRYRLTRRETDVLRRALDGMKNVEIAEELSVSEQTVKDYLSSIYIKTDTKNRMDLLGFLLNTPENFGE